MTREKFLHELDNALRVLTRDERLDILQDYEEHFDLGLEAGKTEEEVVQSLGSPTQIAKELLATYQVNQDYAEQRSTGTKTESALRSLFVLLVLGFFNLVFVVWMAIVAVLLIFGGWLVIGALLVSPIIVVANIIAHPGVFAWFDIFFSLALFGVGYFMGLVMWYVSKFTAKIMIGYAKWNIKLVKGA